MFVTAGWSQRRFIPDLPTYNNPLSATHYLNATTNVRSPGNSSAAPTRSTTTSCNNHFLQQRFIAHYNSQCCGFAVEYQNVQLRHGVRRQSASRQDHRFNISFTLAGIGTFSNLLARSEDSTTR